MVRLMKQPLTLLTIDMESAYSPQYSLSKMTTQEYIDDPRFEVIGVAVKKNDEPTAWFSGTHKAIQHWLEKFPWEHSIAVIHNANFDASILAWRFGIRPKIVVCTLAMGRALHGTSVGGSLKTLAEYYEIGQKGDEVLHAIGKWRKDFTVEELERYGEYCRNDVDLTYRLFCCMAPQFNAVEIHLISMTVKMHSEPMFQLDRGVLERHLQDVRDNKERLLTESGLTSEDLRSDQRLAEVLKNMGVEPPTKVSARTGKEAYAFAKSDEAFKEMLEHDDPRVQAIVAARLGVKTTIEESRTERFIAIHDAAGALPVPLQYYKAMTGRWAGADKINLQNLPRTSALKKAIIAPLGYTIVGADLSNIELRVGLAFAGQQDKLRMLGEGLDLYKDFVAPIFNVAYAEVNDGQRFIGKTCIAEGELVLTERGLIPIEKIKVEDRVWDGVEWVHHDGVMYMGEKDVIEYQGLRATSDHIVYLEDGTSSEFRDAANKGARIASTGNGRSAIKLLDDHKHRNQKERQSRRATAISTLRLRIGEMAASGVIFTRTIKKLSSMRIEAQPCWQGASYCGEPSSRATSEQSYRYISTMQQPKRQGLQELWWSWDRVPFWFRERIGGLLTNLTRMGCWERNRSYSERRALRNGKLEVFNKEGAGEQSKKYAVRIMERGEDSSARVERESVYSAINHLQIRAHGDDRRGDNCDGVGVSSEEAQKLERDKSKVRVYDIINAGPRHAFTVSNCLVSNCQLSLIYGTGAKKLRAAIKADSRYGTDIGEDLAQSIVNTYRTDYSNVKAAWYNAGRALEAVWLDTEDEIGLGPLKLRVRGSQGIELPSGLFMQYPQLDKSTNAEGREQWTYKQRKGRSWETVYIHSAKCFQNVIQALARCIMGEAMVRINKRYRVGLTIHDACYTVVPVDEAEEALQFIICELKKPPAWMPNIPLDAEGGIGENLAFKMGKVQL